MPREGRISGPSTGFEVTVPGRQSIRALRNSIPLAGAPTSIETSLRGLLILCSAQFLLVVSRQRIRTFSFFSTYSDAGAQILCRLAAVKRNAARVGDGPFVERAGPGRLP